MSGYEILERCVCRLPNFIPYWCWRCCLFRTPFVFQNVKPGVCVVLTLIDCFFCFCSAYTGNQWQFTALSIFFYAVIFLLAVRTKPGKILFVLFLLLNYAALVAVSAIYLISRLYPSLEKYSTNRFGTVWVLIVVVLLTMPLVWFYINRKIRPLISSSVPETEHSWRMLWLIPAVFYCIYYYGWYANWSGSNSFYDYCAQLTNVLFVIFLNLGLASHVWAGAPPSDTRPRKSTFAAGVRIPQFSHGTL